MCFGKKSSSNGSAVSQTVLPAAQAVAAQPVSSATNVKTAVVNGDTARNSDANIHQDTAPKDGVDNAISNSDAATGTVSLNPVKKRKNITGLDL